MIPINRRKIVLNRKWNEKKTQHNEAIVNHINRRRADKLLKNSLSIEVVAEIDRKMRRNPLYLQ